MADLRIATPAGTDAILENAAVETLAASLRGPLLRPGEDGYDRARIVWNGTESWRPRRTSPQLPEKPAHIWRPKNEP